MKHFFNNILFNIASRGGVRQGRRMMSMATTCTAAISFGMLTYSY